MMAKDPTKMTTKEIDAVFRKMSKQAAKSETGTGTGLKARPVKKSNKK